MKDRGKINVLIVDKSDIVRKDMLFEFAHHAFIKICGIAQDCQQAVKLARKNRADVIIIDADTDETECFNTINVITENNDGTAVIVWSCNPDEKTVDKARRAGASACIPKDRIWTQLTSIIQAVAHGNCYFWIFQNSPEPEHVSCP